MAYKKPEGTFEVRAFVPITSNKDIKKWMINKDQTDKNVASGLIIEDYFTIISKIKASIEETKGLTDTYKKDEVLKVLEGLING